MALTLSVRSRMARAEIAERDGGYRCTYCGVELPPEELTLDHVIPRSRGGRDGINNRVLSCPPCDTAKANRTPDEWRAGIQPDEARTRPIEGEWADLCRSPAPATNAKRKLRILARAAALPPKPVGDPLVTTHRFCDICRTLTPSDHHHERPLPPVRYRVTCGHAVDTSGPWSHHPSHLLMDGPFAPEADHPPTERQVRDQCADVDDHWMHA